MADATGPVSAIVAAVRHWPRLSELSSFAVDRHGFGCTDGGFGVTYPGDRDEWDRDVEGMKIPPGSVSVYGGWGTLGDDDLLVSAAFSLETLADILAGAGPIAEANRVRAVLAQTGAASIVADVARLSAHRSAAMTGRSAQRCPLHGAHH